MFQNNVSELPARLREKIYVEPNTGCWLWTGTLHRQGYAHVSNGTRNRKSLAHRIIYELLIGPITNGLEPDHLCRTRCCVNPAHLELVDHRTNILRGKSPSAVHALKTHCKKGHPLTGENLRFGKRGNRVCRTCNAASAKAWRQRVG